MELIILNDDLYQLIPVTKEILEGIVKMAPGLADIDDPIAEELGFGPRKLMRDPFAPNPFKNEDDQAKTNIG